MDINTGSKSPGVDWKGHALPSFNTRVATAKLVAASQGQSFLADAVGMISRHDSLSLASNSPNEDHMVSTGVEINGSRWWAGAVYDGHAGHHTATTLAHSLIPSIASAIQRFSGADRDNKGLAAAVTEAFVGLDAALLEDARSALADAQTFSEAQSRLAPVYAGSCALFVLYDPATSQLHVANCGDSRAVLGRYDATTSSYETVELSDDHAAANPSEAARKQAEHPGEEGLIFKRTPKDCDRWVNIAVTRAFGDYLWKWSTEDVQLAQQKFAGRAPNKQVVNPPYLDAIPEVQSFRVDEGDFLILASDGLWEVMDSEDAVWVVEEWKKRVKPHGKGLDLGSGEEKGFNGQEIVPGRADFIGVEEQRKIERGNFVFEDENVAVHLTKNALGGNMRQIFCGRMTMDLPLCRMVRDDISVQVVFFGHE